MMKFTNYNKFFNYIVIFISLLCHILYAIVPLFCENFEDTLS